MTTVTHHYVASQFTGTTKQRAYKARWANHYQRELKALREYAQKDTEAVIYVEQAEQKIKDLLPPVELDEMLIEQDYDATVNDASIYGG